MPKWMRWIESVKTLDDPDLTDWTLAAQGFRFSRKARITQRLKRSSFIGNRQGLPTKGGVRFYAEQPDRTAVKLTVTYERPRVSPLMEPTILGGIVTKELQANLDRFRDLVEDGAAAHA